MAKPNRVLTTFLAVLAVAAARPVLAETLEGALARTYASNPTIEAARAEVRSTDEDMAQAVSGFRPSVSAEASIGDKSYDNKATGVDTTLTPKSYSLSLSQPIYSGGGTLAAIDEARHDILAARASMLSVEQTVLQDAVAAYMSVVRDRAVLDLNVNNEQVLARQLKATRDRFEVGEITRTDVHQAEARLARATAARIQARGDLDASHSAYLRVIGTAAEKLDVPKPPTDLPADVDAAVRIARESNPTVVAAAHSERSARAAVTSAASDLLPSVALSGEAARDREATSSSSDTQSLSATLTLTVPLYQSGSTYSKLRQAKQDAARKRHQLEEARRSAESSARKAWESLATVRARTESVRAQISAAETALDGVRREAEVGSRTVLDVLDAEQELLDARVALVSAQRDELVAAFSVKAAVGEMTAKALKLNVEYYDPERHYREVRGKFFGTSSSGE